MSGAAGHLGGNLVRLLLAEGHDVRALVRTDIRAVDGLAVEVVKADVLDVVSLGRAFAGVDVVFHLAARISVTGEQGGRVSAVNVLGTRNVVQACLAEGVGRLVHMSSIHAFCQLPKEGALDESRGPSDPGRAPAYDRSKARGEREVLAGVRQGLDAVILNPTAVLGPFDFKPSRMGRVLLALGRGAMPALVDGAFDWVDVRDVCRAALTAASRGRRGERYLLSGSYTSVAALAEEVARATGVSAPRVTVSQWLVRPVAPLASAWSRVVGSDPLLTSDSLTALRTCHPRISHAKAAAELGFEPRRLERTVSDTLEWFVGAGLLPAGRCPGD